MIMCLLFQASETVDAGKEKAKEATGAAKVQEVS